MLAGCMWQATRGFTRLGLNLYNHDIGNNKKTKFHLRSYAELDYYGYKFSTNGVSLQSVQSTEQDLVRGRLAIKSCRCQKYHQIVPLINPTARYA